MSDRRDIKTAIESMSDIFILRSNGKIAHLNYEDYAKKELIVESITRAEDTRKYFFFNKDDGSFPANLTGPTITKVIDWNLEPQGNADVDKKPGYFIDLRRITLNRLDSLKSSETDKLKRDKALSNTQLGGIREVPYNKLYQLAQSPEEDNVYIAFYKHLDKVRSPLRTYSYCISYIPASVLDKHELSSAPNVEGIDVDETTAYLESYYGQTCAQSGAMNPDDMEILKANRNNTNKPNTVDGVPSLNRSSAAACYVANLRTFKG
ncbi:hypothetical protein [Vibrio nigripulchritudo]|uniref:hypothetical protein n=1 Tax=Vibrio nigripulchritudo TaxID=28173 RepID=UPI0003B17EED|nr:hypothetical protein [Vibrio nigripulchritudo]CCN72244.1 hypothetical protein VIBNISFn118_530029 [Vibrio nigripulchritudo SFn118]